VKEIEIDIKLKPFVKAIFVLENKGDEHRLPFYADGYPGLMFSDCVEPVILLPSNKELSKLFLYGQTIEPIELLIKGNYKIIVFQLYPFATRLLLGIDPKEINDECFDLNDLSFANTEETLKGLVISSTKQQIETLSKYILHLVKHSTSNQNNLIKLAVTTIINTKGNIQIKSLRNQLFVTERTFERKFTKEIGVTPKQFAKIVQFNFSIKQLQEDDYYSLTDVAYNNNFTDQSHFIRTFRKYSGQTPKEFLARVK